MKHKIPSMKSETRKYLTFNSNPITSNHQSNPMKIVSATITQMPRPMPAGMFDSMPEVIATFEDGSVKTLFSFHPDEVSFLASEFIGLTEAEARSLLHRKDVAFLQS